MFNVATEPAPVAPAVAASDKCLFVFSRTTSRLFFLFPDKPSSNASLVADQLLSNKFAILITELLDETLTEKKNRYNFSIDEIKSIGIQLIESIEYIHSNKYLYIDLKPDNIMFDNKNNLKLVDFNACSKYLNCQSEFYENILLKNPIGNFIYSSININKSYSGIRIDDIESVLWIMLYLLDKDIITDINNQKSLNKLIDIKEKYILNYLLGRDKFIFNFIEELKTYDSINNKKPNYRKFITILQND